MMRYLIALTFLCGAQLAAAEPPSPQTPSSQVPAREPPKASKWMQSEKSLLLVDARIAIPVSIAGLRLKGTHDFSHPGEAIDSAAHYESEDGKMFATAYIYYPGLPHGGLAALATDVGIKSNSTTKVTGPQWQIVEAAGGKTTAIQGSYANYRGNLATRAAFLKGGRYIVKLRVSGPEERRPEIDAAMAALLDGIQFGALSPPHPAAQIQVTPCAGGEERKKASKLPDPSSGEIAAITFLGTFDGGGVEATDEQGKRATLPSRVPGSFCSTHLESGVLVLRSAPGEALSIDGRTRLVVLIGDAGQMLEVVDARNLKGYVMLLHGVGQTRIHSVWDGVPSDGQLESMLSGKSGELNRALGTVVLRPGGRDELHLRGAPEDQPANNPAGET